MLPGLRCAPTRTNRKRIGSKVSRRSREQTIFAKRIEQTTGARATTAHRQTDPKRPGVAQPRRRSTASPVKTPPGKTPGVRGGGRGRKNDKEPLRPPRMEGTQVRPRLAQHAVQAFDFERQHASAQPFEAVVAPPGIARRGARCGLFDQPVKDEFFQVVVERAGTELVLPRGLTGDLLHDALAVQVRPRQRKQDVQRGRGERKESGWLRLHTRNPIYRIPSMVVKRFLSANRSRNCFETRFPLAMWGAKGEVFVL